MEFRAAAVYTYHGGYQPFRCAPRYYAARLFSHVIAVYYTFQGLVSRPRRSGPIGSRCALTLHEAHSYNNFSSLRGSRCSAAMPRPSFYSIIICDRDACTRQVMRAYTRPVVERGCRREIDSFSQHTSVVLILFHGAEMILTALMRSRTDPL